MKTEASGRGALLRSPNFRWLMAGSAISLLGDQFTLVALPWLVLHRTGDTVALGLVLALVGVPRAVLMLLGGALVDRLSPQRVLMVTKYVNAALLAALALGVHFDALPMAAIYALSLAIGVSSAFGIPSATSMLPHALPPSQLAAANGAMMGLRQLSMFAGPLAAGVLIAVSGDGRSDAADGRGLALAFGFDALSFLLSAWTLAQVRTREGAGRAAGESLWAATWQGLRHVWADTQLRACYLYWAAVAVLALGPLHIALPVLAHERAGLGASALGLMLGAHGAGTLAGMVVAGTRPHWRIGTLGTSVLLADAAIGLLCIPLGWVTAGWQGAALMLGIGVVGGFLQVAVFTWMQRRVPAAMVGRATSLFMFIFMGLVPLASAVAGVLMRWVSLAQLFAVVGGLLVAAAAAAWAFSPIRAVSDRPPLAA